MELVDGRYHVASLAAVFLSLGLGILIGLTLGSDAESQQQQGLLIRTIEEHLSGLRSMNAQLQTDLEMLGQTLRFQEEAMTDVARLLAKELTGKKVGILTDQQAASLAWELKDFLQGLGVKAGVVVWKNSQNLQPETDWQAVGKAVAFALTGQGLINPIENLISSGQVQFDGELQPKDALILMGSADWPFIDSLMAETGNIGIKGIIAGIQEAVPSFSNQDWKVINRVESMGGRLLVAMALL
jgi:hypothetical protein